MFSAIFLQQRTYDDNTTFVLAAFEHRRRHNTNPEAGLAQGNRIRYTSFTSSLLFHLLPVSQMCIVVDGSCLVYMTFEPLRR